MRNHSLRNHRRSWRTPVLSVLFVSATLTLGLMSATAGPRAAADTGVARTAPASWTATG